MGIFDKLRPRRKESSAEFSDWLGQRLQKLSALGTFDDAASVQLLTELDERLQGHLDANGPAGLEQAVDLWVDRVDDDALAVVLAGTGWLDRGLAALEAESGEEAKGYRQLVLTLRNLGLLSVGDLAPDPDWKPDGRTAIYQMLEAVWPFAESEEALRVRLFELTGADTRLITWEVAALRTWTMGLALAAQFRDDPAAGEEVRSKVLSQLTGRIEGVGHPADFEEWLERRYEGFTAAIRKATGRTGQVLLTNAIGRQFARNLNSGNVELRCIGTDVFVNAYRQFRGLAKAFREYR
jgi:hypothetical protein